MGTACIMRLSHCLVVPRRIIELLILPVSEKYLYNILYNVGTTSKTLGRRCTNVVQMFSVCWVTRLYSPEPYVTMLYCYRSSAKPSVYCSVNMEPIFTSPSLLCKLPDVGLLRHRDTCLLRNYNYSVCRLFLILKQWN